MKREKTVIKGEIADERREILGRLEDWLEMPMLVLSILWLALFVVETIWGISPLLETASNVIWAIFWIDFAIKFTLSPDKLSYLRSNWLTVLALALPALRIFRAFRAFRLLRAARAARGIRLVRLLTSLNRGMKALGASFERRGFGYVLALTAFVLFAGAAAMYSFENDAADGMRNYSDALWWTAMLLTTMGTDYFPRTAEGRMLCLILAVYGFAVFGYVTATLATFFLARDAEETTEPTLRELKEEIAQLRQVLAEKQLQG